ncbi:MAG: RHS repeat-associated core domain-containing protein [Methylacidiphilales bacterium]|nr:RHS repeat-associated core domain-containing protein [Candidatus Methylacidiphilales bacterium]
MREDALHKQCDAQRRARYFTPSGQPYYSATRLRVGYTGREMLVNTWGGLGAGLYDYRNRIYSTVHGRFLQPDPIGFDAGDVNWYRYVGNNAVNYTDPEGLWGIFVHAAYYAAKQGLNACHNIKCKEPCEACCGIAFGVGWALLKGALVSDLMSCPSFGFPWVIAACGATASAVYLAESVSLASDFQNCKIKCASKKSTKAPDCCE